jgi:glyoxylase-like metal-dependent hydrolase (beta-lactamase superfamily II)
MAAFEEIVPGLHRLALLPLDLINVYLLDDVLVDAGAPMSARRILDALDDRRIAAVALTHGHFDHQGGAHAVCEARGVPLWCGGGDREAVETGDLTLLYPQPAPAWIRVTGSLGGPAHPVARTLREGDDVGSFTVVETPGHTPGHLAFWREDDRALVLGDVLFHRNPLTFQPGLAEPYSFLVHDLARNRESLRRLIDLEPEVICFGHGEPIRKPHRVRRFLRALDDDGAARVKRLGELPATARSPAQ